MPVAFSVFGTEGGKSAEKYYDLTGAKKGIFGIHNAKEAERLLRKTPMAGFSSVSGGGTAFKDIFRAVNAQTGNDSELLFEIEPRRGKAAVPRPALKAGREFFLSGSDKGSGYAVAAKPFREKTSGCLFFVQRNLPGPALAWHYLWDYLKNYPARFYNAVPVTKKYGYTYIDPDPLVTLEACFSSRALKTGFSKDAAAKKYASVWMRKIGDFRGLWFFYFALSNSAAAGKVSLRPEFRNAPVWCPELKPGSYSRVKAAAALGYLLAKKRYSGKFRGFDLMHKGAVIASAIDFFNQASAWGRKAELEKYLLNGINNDILNCCDDERALLDKIDGIMTKLYLE